MGELGIGLKIESINSSLRGIDVELRSKNAELRSKSDQLVALVTQESAEANRKAEELKAENFKTGSGNPTAIFNPRTAEVDGASAPRICGT